MKQRILISFEPKQMAILKRLSHERSKSVSELVRQAVEKYTEKAQKNPATLLLESLRKKEKMLKKAFANAEPDLSKHVDEIVYGI